jgi:nicotinamide mononucleotide (NMN) deamidase PncC
MEPTQQALIEALHKSPGHCVLALTGGGAGAAAMLLEVPGASRTVLEVVVPYHEQALTEFLGRRPEQFCSAATSREMAVRAHARAQWLAPGVRVAGVACTATLATDRPKRGEHRFHIAVHDGLTTTISSLTLTKGARDRAGEEGILDVILLNALAAVIGIPERVKPALLPEESVEVVTHPATDALSAFLRGEAPVICIGVDGQVQVNHPLPTVLIPGAFNPLHKGHLTLAAAAREQVGGSWAFELSVTNVDKPSLAPEEIRRRQGQFTWKAPLWLTRAPTFREKAALFPGVLFAVGVDTAARIVAPRYYGDNEAAMIEALETIRAQGCRFLIGGRLDTEGRFIQLRDLAIPPAFQDLFQALPEESFRVDISSTQLRVRASD